MFGFIKIGNTAEQVVKRIFKDALADSEHSIITIINLQDSIKRLKEERDTAKFQRDLEEKELAHLLKMRDEKSEVEYKKKEVELDRKFQLREMELQKQYFEKVMSTVQEGQKKMENIYAEILSRLPNVNVEIRRK